MLAAGKGKRSDQSSAGFGRGQATTLAIAGILGAAWIGGTVAFMIMWMPMLVFEVWLALWLIITGAPLGATPAS